jgi:hypothetical protein
LFGRNVEVATVPVPCDVLFLYCSFEPSGKIVGQEGSLRSLIRDSKATVAVIASPLTFDLNRESRSKVLDRGDNPPVNLVITLNRNGDNFGRFFKSLFELMWTQGLSMPVAWPLLVFAVDSGRAGVALVRRQASRTGRSGCPT